MRDFVYWIAAGVLLAGCSALALRDVAPPEPPAFAVVGEGVDMPRDFVVVPFADALPEPPPIDYRAWCEPVDAPLCRTSEDCRPLADGTPRLCTREWWVEGSEMRVCTSRAPRPGVQQWRSDRLAVLVNEICKPADGCDPEQLHDYLAVLALRESSWRPHAVHRLNGDREAALASWRRMADHYAESPARDEPWRWVSLGYFGQNTALHLERWDATTVPEVLCGEVEATLVLLRVARDRVRRLERGVDCDGEPHFGTADGAPGSEMKFGTWDGVPSWYDVSQANSGSDACPAKAGRPLAVREGFERRARSRGLDPYGRVTLAMLGRPIDPAEQDRFAAKIRTRMDAEHPRPR